MSQTAPQTPQPESVQPAAPQPASRKRATIGLASILAVIGVVTVGYSVYQEASADKNKTTETAALPGTQTSNADPKAVIAKVGDKTYTRADLNEFMDILPPQVRQIPLDLIYKPVVEQFVNSKLAAAEAYRAGLDHDAEVVKRVQLAQDQIVQDVYLNRKVDAATSDAALDEAYKEAVAKVQPEPEIHARHILVKTEQEAKDVIAKLKAGEDFSALAKKLSTDPGQKDGGDLGFFKKEQMVPEFAEVAFKLEPGKYTETPVKTQFGYHVIKVEEKRMSSAPTKEEMLPTLKKQVADKVLKDSFDAMRKAAGVQVFGLDGKPLAEDKAPAEKPKG